MTLIFMTIMLSIMFTLMHHPISFGVILLLQTIIISILSSIMNINYWFSYILFLIMVGGMLILFIYMTSIASNEKFFSISVYIKMMVMLLYSFIILFFMNNWIIENFHVVMAQSFNHETVNIQQLVNNNMQMNKFLTMPFNKMFMLIVIYLLISLIAIVKITKTNSGPLRQTF
uniref:NADH-ubiquinone oxidoreductase chain 6 n=1 Tax=Coleoptera sp. 2 AH-2016 TaxID=1903824 RepID=A0A343C2G2_9COLE|nr:NADH dehydrogenase subunit 6 [Coleoptera sp. 2 AH-2016]